MRARHRICGAGYLGSTRSAACNARYSSAARRVVTLRVKAAVSTKSTNGRYVNGVWASRWGPPGRGGESRGAPGHAIGVNVPRQAGNTESSPAGEVGVAGRAPALHAGGSRFESGTSHQPRRSEIGLASLWPASSRGEELTETPMIAAWQGSQPPASSTSSSSVTPKAGTWARFPPFVDALPRLDRSTSCGSGSSKRSNSVSKWTDRSNQPSSSWESSGSGWRRDAAPSPFLRPVPSGRTGEGA